MTIQTYDGHLMMPKVPSESIGSSVRFLYALLTELNRFRIHVRDIMEIAVVIVLPVPVYDDPLLDEVLQEILMDTQLTTESGFRISLNHLAQQW